MGALDVNGISCRIPGGDVLFTGVTFASRVRSTKTKIERFEATAPSERVRDEQVTMRLGGNRTGTRVVICEHLEPVFA